jgi:uncharacterized protein YndB with AHSA1/START domain
MTMAPIVSHFEIARSPEEIYPYITDPARFPEWQHDVARVHIEGDGPPGLGTRFTTTRRIGRVEQTTVQEITRDDPPSGWAARGVDGPFRPNAAVTIEPLGSGSLVTVELDFEGHGVGKLLPLDAIRRIAARGAPRSFENLKNLLERGTTEPKGPAPTEGPGVPR